MAERKHKQMQELMFGDILHLNLTITLSVASQISSQIQTFISNILPVIKSTTKNSRENTQSLLCTLCAIHSMDNSAG